MHMQTKQPSCNHQSALYSCQVSTVTMAETWAGWPARQEGHTQGQNGVAASPCCRQNPHQVPARIQVWPCGVLKSSRQKGDFNHLNFSQVHSALCGIRVSYSISPQSRPGPKQKPASSTRWVTQVGVFPAQHSSLFRNKQDRCGQQDIPGLCSVAP